MPYADRERRREYQRQRVLTPEQKARKAERARERRKDPVFLVLEQKQARKRQACMTDDQKARRREQAQLYQRAKRAAMTPEQLEANRAWHREYDKVRRKDPTRRAYSIALKRRLRAADKFDREFSLDADMTCCNPRCNLPQVSDRYGPTGLCRGHLDAAG